MKFATKTITLALLMMSIMTVRVKRCGNGGVSTVISNDEDVVNTVNGHGYHNHHHDNGHGPGVNTHEVVGGHSTHAVVEETHHHHHALESLEAIEHEADQEEHEFEEEEHHHHHHGHHGHHGHEQVVVSNDYDVSSTVNGHGSHDHYHGDGHGHNTHHHDSIHGGHVVESHDDTAAAPCLAQKTTTDSDTDVVTIVNGVKDHDHKHKHNNGPVQHEHQHWNKKGQMTQNIHDNKGLAQKTTTDSDSDVVSIVNGVKQHDHYHKHNNGKVKHHHDTYNKNGKKIEQHDDNNGPVALAAKTFVSNDVDTVVDNGNGKVIHDHWKGNGKKTNHVHDILNNKGKVLSHSVDHNAAPKLL